MTQLRPVAKTFVASAVLLLSILAPGQALALVAPPDTSDPSTCQANSDCQMGFECTVVGGSACGGAAPVPTCPPGETCEPAPIPQPCVAMEYKACTPARCMSDADCADGMICHSYTSPCPITDCACSSDMPDCDCGTPVACMPETFSMCTPRYVLPCGAAADCGPGFTCEEQQSCGCAGSSGGGATPNGDAAPGFAPLPPEGMAGAPAEMPEPADPLPPECSCEPSGVFACIPQEIACDDASDCPSGWICQQEVQADRPACFGEGCPTPEPLLPARFLCQPEYYGGVGVDDAGGVPVSGGPKGGTGTSSPEASPTPNSSGSGEESRESAACQMGHAPASSGVLSLLAVLGALLGLKRRRA
ncbi:MAG TPA: hypothetical protein VJN18_10485 [Polyangiaceae bacterium]|nr:hypothetical protein [Polyangiaceae bacterium]